MSNSFSQRKQIKAGLPFPSPGISPGRSLRSSLCPILWGNFCKNKWRLTVWTITPVVALTFFKNWSSEIFIAHVTVKFFFAHPHHPDTGTVFDQGGCPLNKTTVISDGFFRYEKHFLPYSLPVPLTFPNYLRLLQ